MHVNNKEEKRAVAHANQSVNQSIEVRVLQWEPYDLSNVEGLFEWMDEVARSDEATM